jgi:4-hydroxybutyrate CoA-transferase
VIGALAGKRDLGLHSGMLPARIRGCLDGAAFTGAAKTYEPGLHVATGVLDPTAEPSLAWGGNVRLAPISVTHSPRTLAALEHLWSINSAFELDLAGQVNAEFAAGARVASGGGQSDFMRAAHLSPGGAAVLALPSRSRDGSPRIVPRLATPHLTATAADLDYVVTEQGVAKLRGASACERAEALIAVAHPGDRAELTRLRSGELSPR